MKPRRDAPVQEKITKHRKNPHQRHPVQVSILTYNGGGSRRRDRLERNKEHKGMSKCGKAQN